MADNEQENNGTSDKSSHTPSIPGSNTDSSFELSGWMMKRSKMTRQWKKRYFLLKDTDLCYGETDQKLQKKISLLSAEIAECNIDQKDNAFRIRPLNSRRVHYMYTDNETDQHNWMQAICFAKASGQTADKSEACSIQ